jgi:hypothetical protein
MLYLCLVYGWWIVSLVSALRDRKGSLVSVFTISFFWPFLGNGLVAIAAAPPPRAALLYHDINHIGSFLFGGLATY